MAQINETLYETIADEYSAIWVALNGVSLNAREAVDAIVDVTTTAYMPYGTAVADADAALEIELNLLDVFNAAYVAVQGIAASSSSLLSAVRAVNSFVITNYDTENGYGGTIGTTPDTQLADFVINGIWNGRCIPEGWYELSSDAGYNVTSWEDYVCVS